MFITFFKCVLRKYTHFPNIIDTPSQQIYPQYSFTKPYQLIFSSSLDLEDGLFDAAVSDERGVGGVRCECYGLSGLGMDRLGDWDVFNHESP